MSGFGLRIPSKKGPGLQKTSDLFENPKETSTTSNGLTIPVGPSKIDARKALELQEAALTEDAALFDYDRVYDQVSSTARHKAQRDAEMVDRRPKYMESIMAAAALRKEEREVLRMQRIKAEDKDGDTQPGEEVFITAAYRKKLQDMRAKGIDPEKMKRERGEDEDRETRIGDKDLVRFYQNMARSRVDRAKSPESRNGHGNV